MAFQEKIDSIIKKLAIEALEKELQPLAQTIMYLSDKYSFLFNHDPILTKDKIVQVFHLPEQSLLDEEAKIKFDQLEFIAGIDPKTKEEIVNAVFEKFAEQSDVTELKELTSQAHTERGSVDAHSSSNTE